MIRGDHSAVLANEQVVGVREGWLAEAEVLRPDFDGAAGDLTGRQPRAYVVDGDGTGPQCLFPASAWTTRFTSGPMRWH